MPSTMHVADTAWYLVIYSRVNRLNNVFIQDLSSVDSSHEHANEASLTISDTHDTNIISKHGTWDSPD